jgi:hypothetical protein
VKRALLFVVMVASCTEPVREKQIQSLGDEDPNVPTGIDHRPGQPCLVCHSEGGPADNKPFVVAGTVYATRATNAPGAPNVFIRFVDSQGAGPNVDIQTSQSGNFAVTPAQFPDLAFPLKVAIFDSKKNPLQVMETTINREGSCNFCHDPLTDDSRTSIGQIYVGASR